MRLAEMRGNGEGDAERGGRKAKAPLSRPVFQTQQRDCRDDFQKSSAQQGAKHEQCIRTDTTLIREVENSPTAFEQDQSKNAPHNLKNRDGNDRGCWSWATAVTVRSTSRLHASAF